MLDGLSIGVTRLALLRRWADSAGLSVQAVMRTLQYLARRGILLPVRENSVARRQPHPVRTINDNHDLRG
jgi:hypothetical protein